MRNWNDASVTLESECPWIEDSTDALLVAEKLGIPFQVIDFSELYQERIVDYMFNEYEKFVNSRAVMQLQLSGVILGF